jgi:hypothetical protein
VLVGGTVKLRAVLREELVSTVLFALVIGPNAVSEPEMVVSPFLRIVMAFERALVDVPLPISKIGSVKFQAVGDPDPMLKRPIAVDAYEPDLVPIPIEVELSPGAIVPFPNAVDCAPEATELTPNAVEFGCEADVPFPKAVELAPEAVVF